MRRQHTYSPELMPTESKQLLCQQWKKSKDMTVHSENRLYPGTDRRVPHISLVFREMWDTAGLALKPVAGSHSSVRVPYVRTSVRGPKTMAKPTTAFRFFHIFQTEVALCYWSL
jgi:hypothetical protein